LGASVKSNTLLAARPVAARYVCSVDNTTNLSPAERAALRRNVRDRMDTLGLTQDELAHEAGISSVKMLLKRGSGRAATLRAVARVLKVSVDDLLKRGEEKQPRNPELNKMLEASEAVTGEVQPDELEFLENLEAPEGRSMTARAYLLALDAYRAMKKID
jgi:transcriptional regulator with XRE-family HTH domain